MPTISMFYGIIIRMFFRDNENINFLTFTPNIKVRSASIRSRRENCWQARCQIINKNWSLHG